MRKVKLLYILLVLIVSAFVLTACGADKAETDKQPAKSAEASDDFDDDDADDIEDDADEDDDNDDDRAVIKHDLDGAVFYTEHEVEEWIENGVFDFAEFADDFDMGDGVEKGGLHVGSSDFYAELMPGEEEKINAFGICRGGVCNVRVIDAEPSGQEVKLANGYTVPYELLEIGLYMTEFAENQRVDYEKPVQLDWLYDVGLPDRFGIMFWQ